MTDLVIYTDGGLRPDPSIPQGWGHGGTGVTCIDLDQVTLFEIANHHSGHPVAQSNQTMEMMAVIEALEYVQAHPLLRDRKVFILSDSAYVVNCFTDEWWCSWMLKNNGAWVNSSKKPVENAHLWRRIIALCRFTYLSVSQRLGPKPWPRLGNALDATAIKAACDTGLDVTFLKVKGHSGDKLNDRADMLATMGKNCETLLTEYRA